MEMRKNTTEYLKVLNSRNRSGHLEGLFFKMRTEDMIVGNQIQFSSKSKIVSGSVKYTDSYGYEIVK
ncbi:MAG: hypothetical protein ACRC7S_08460, partial [Cetobacterium sp.]